MIVEKSLVLEAREKLGEKTAKIIAEDLQLENFDEVNLKALCPFHREDTPSFVYNVKGNYFKCFGCGKNYNIIDHYIEYKGLSYLEAVAKLFDEVGIEYKFGEKNVKTDRKYRYPHRVYSSDRTKVENYLETRGISKKNLDNLDIQQDNNGNVVFHFYDSNDVLTLVKYRPAKKLDSKDTKTWCQKDADTKNILFNMNRVDPNQPLLITEGEIDCLCAIESGYNNAVSIPLGVQNTGWIEENFEWLEQFEQIIIWFDNDDIGQKYRKEVCSRLGIYKTLYVDLPKFVEIEDKKYAIKDINHVLFRLGKQAVLDYINDAEEMPITGVSNLANIQDFDISKAAGLYSGLKPIDDKVYKFLFGSVLLLTGVKGSGKSTALNQIFICESLNQGHDAFIYSGELSTPVLKSWIELVMAGREKTTIKSNGHVHIIDPVAKKQMREWYSGRIWAYDDDSNNADVILDRAIAVTRKYGVKTWILDNLMCLDIGAKDTDIYQKQKDFIVKLVRLAQTYNVLIVLVAHPRKIQNGQKVTADDIAGSGDLGNMAQYVISVNRVTDKEKQGEKNKRDGTWRVEPVRFDVVLDVLKNRYTGLTGNSNLYFDRHSYRFYSQPSELFKRYKWWNPKDDERTPVPKTDPNKHDDMPF